MSKHMCGHCELYNGGCTIGGGPTAYGERCKFIPSRWIDRHAGKGREMGNPGSFHVTHEGERVKDYTTFRTKKGPVSFKKGKGEKGATRSHTTGKS